MKFLTLLSIVVLSSSSARSDICVPGKIDTVTVAGTTEISWVSNPNGCDVENFSIDVYDSETNITLIYTTNSTSLAVNLILCKEYTFDVRAITSENVSGPSNKVTVSTKLSEDDNVGVQFTTITNSGSNVVFNWALVDPSVARCVSGYKVISWDEVDSPQTSEVTEPSITFKSTVFCMTYYLTVSAEVTEAGITPPSIDGSVRAAPSGAPGMVTLTKETIGSDYVDFLFNVPSYGDYRCSFTSVLEIIGPELDEQYSVNLTDNAERNHVVAFHVINLKPNTVYTGQIDDENEAGKSDVLTFQFTTPAK